MEVDYGLLQTIHRILRQQTDLRERLEKGPRRVKIAEQAQSNFAQELEQAKQNLIQAKMNADEKQLQLDSREAKIEELKGKLNAAESNREYQLLKDQIAADEQANLVLSDELFEVLEKIDTLELAATEAAENLQKAEQEHNEFATRLHQKRQT